MERLKALQPIPVGVAEEMELVEAFLQQDVADPEQVPIESPLRAGIPRDPPPTLYLSIVPEAGLPGVSLEALVAAQQEVLLRGGYNPGARLFPWLLDLGIEHAVFAIDTLGVWLELEPNLRVGLPGADLQACRFTASLLGQALDQAAVAVWLPGSAAPVWRGFRLVKPDNSPFTQEDAFAVWRSLFQARNIAFHLAHDRRAVEIWDYDRRTGAEVREFALRIIAGLGEAGFSASLLVPITGDSFLVWRDEYSRYLEPSEGGRQRFSLSEVPGYQNLVQAHQEIVRQLQTPT